MKSFPGGKGAVALAFVTLSAGRLRGMAHTLQNKGTRGACSTTGGIYMPDTERCECFQCFSGSDCSSQDEKCVLTDAGGNPTVYQQYWMQVAETHQTPSEPSTETAAADFRSPYAPCLFAGSCVMSEAQHSLGIQPALYQAIIDIHDLVGNAETKGYSVVTGHGCTELIGAVQFAAQAKLERTHGRRRINVFAKAPYYDGYSKYSTFARDAVFNGSQTSLTNYSVVEFVTYPNNPNGDFRFPHYNNALATVHDMVYYWPSLVNISAGGGKMAEDVMLFSMSKLTGHAGTRLGWALVKDHQFASDMDAYIRAVSLHVSIDSQHRTAVLLKALANQMRSGGGGGVGLVGPGGMFEWVRGTMEVRWKAALAALAASDRFTNLAVSGTFYLWLRCNKAADADCAATLRGAGVVGITGTMFGATAQFARLEMVLADANFHLLVSRLTALASSEP